MRYTLSPSHIQPQIKTPHLSMQSITNSNFAAKTLDPPAIRLSEEPATTCKLTITFACSITIKFHPTIQRSFPANIHNCLMMRIFSANDLEQFFNGANEILDDISWVIWSLESFFKNSFVSLSPQMPACSHESCLQPKLRNSNRSFARVFENPIPAINKGKYISYPIRRHKSSP